MDLKLNNTILHFNKIVYVDASRGKDSSKNGSINQPFKSMKSSMNYLNSCESFKSNCAIVLKKGTYDITDCINDNFNNMNISLIAFPGDQGKVLINSRNYSNNKNADNKSFKINMHFYGLIFKDISNDFFNFGNEESEMEYYNCVFSTLTVDKWGNSLIKNCIFDNCVSSKNDGAIKGKCINSADNNNFLKCFDGPKTKLFNNVSIDKKFSIVEKTPDYEGIGVYGGDFTWPLSRSNAKASVAVKKNKAALHNKKNSKKNAAVKETASTINKESIKKEPVKTEIVKNVQMAAASVNKIESAPKVKEIKKQEFKINDVSLKFNKFVYVDAVNGSDNAEFGDLYLPFKTIKKAMDYLNSQPDFKADCALILKEGTYDIKDILDEKTYALRDEYKNMNVQWVAVPGMQGSVIIESSIGSFASSSAMKFYGLVFRDITEGGMFLNDSEYYNCIFDNVAINEEEKALDHKLQNCVFDVSESEYDNARVYEGDFAWSDSLHASNEFKLNDVSLWFDKFVYVDSVNGYDENNGEFLSPFKTLKRSMDYLNNNEHYRSYCAIILKSGSYDISNCLDSETGKLSSEYDGMNISFISDLNAQGKVFINSSIGFDTYSDASSKFYDVVFKDIYGIGLKLHGEYYNCVFDSIKLNEEADKNSFALLNNCVLINSDEKGSVNGKCINCLSNHDKIKCINGEKVSVCYNVLLDKYYNVISDIKEHAGVGANPDNSSANLGIYGGTFAWRLPDYSKCEFKINNTCLKFNKFVYVDINYGNDSNDGSYSNSFKTIKKAMDTLSSNRIQKGNCAIILKCGTYDISDILVENGNSVKDDYAYMNVSFIADIGLQGRVFIRSQKGFIPAIADSEQSIKMNFYRIIFKEIEEGMILNSDNAINDYYNCVFDNISLGGNNKEAVMHNCTFFNTRDMDNGLKSYGKCINCIATNDYVAPSDGEMLSVLFNAWIEPGIYNVTSKGWIGTGIGENSNRTSANLGIYGGEFEWK